jgi:DNA-binding transcriptional LysR family regulator
MELRQLEYLVAVAEEASFTRAAERVHISQSGVSAQIRRLERELGAVLLDRSSRVAKLTPAGRAAIGPARDAIRAARSVRRTVDEVNQVVRGEIAVAMVRGCRIAPFFEALTAFHTEHPNVAIDLSEADSGEMIERLRAGTVDVALAACAGELPADLGSAVIARERLTAVVSLEHPLARHRALQLSTLQGHPLICLPPGTGIRGVFDHACAALGATPTVRIEASTPDAVGALAQRGLGVGIVSESMATPDVHAMRITDVEPDAILALLWHDHHNPAQPELVRTCKAAFGLNEARDLAEAATS